MKISHKKQRRWGIVLTYIQMFLSILVNIICTPIILNRLGQTEFGLYNLTSSIISYLSLLTLGFGASYIRFYSRYKAKNDEEGIEKLNGLYMVVFLIMGFVALILGLILSFNSSILFNNTYSTKDLHIAKILLLLLTFNMAISFPMSVYSAIITSQEEFIFQKIINIGKTFLSPAISIVAIFLGYGSIGMVVSITIISLLIDFLNIYYCKKKINAKFKFGKIDKFLLKEIAIFSFFIAINQLIDQINTQTDKIILGKMINAGAVAVYTIGATIQAMYVNFSIAVHSVFAPKIHKIINSGDKNVDDQLTDLFIKIGRVQFFILMLIATGFVFFGKFFVLKWAGEGYDLVYYLVIILMIPSTVPLIQNIGIEIQRAKNKHQFRSLVYLLIAIINVAMSIVLCKYYGILGVTIGTAFANIVGCCIIMNIYYHKKIGINIIKFWKSIFRASLGLVAPIAFGFLLMKFINFNNFAVYLLFVALYTLAYLISIYLFGLNKEEKSFVNKSSKKSAFFLAKMLFVMLKPLFKLISLCPKKRIVFISFKASQYSDNPKAISEYIHKHYPQIKQVWLFSNLNKIKDQVPSYIIKKKFNFINELYYLSSSAVIVDNDYLAYKKSSTLVRSKNQLFIETWHGDKGFKKCFKCSNNEVFNYKFLSEDKKIEYFLTGSQHAEKTTPQIFNFNGELLKIGCPRNDVFFHKNSRDENTMRKKLQIDENTKVLLYAPTYRSYTNEENPLDFEKIIEALEKKTGKKWIIVSRAHHVTTAINSVKLKDGNNLFGDMAELLPYVDFLITDYSSCAGDFALSGKGIILYLWDYQDFDKADKGFFFDINESPFFKATNTDEIVGIISNNDYNDYKKNDKAILDFYGDYENGTATEKVSQIICEFLGVKK